MNSNDVTVKLEPPDDFDAGTSENVTPPTLQNGMAETGEQSSAIKAGNETLNDSRNFTCLLCDIVCRSRDDLRKHLKTSHASKNYSTMSSTMFLNKLSPDVTSRAFSGYVNYRYTCPVCGAKFKSFRTYLTHNMSHRGSTGLQPFDEARMAALFGTGKKYMQDYLEAEENCSGNFTCSECKTVFVQRDAYAMHMMMRAMNETCKSIGSLQMNGPEAETDENDLKFKADGTEPIETNQAHLLSPAPVEQAQQRCLEDVTAKIDQDEYLKSVLDKVVVSDVTKFDEENYNIDERKVCSFCRESFVDQDALAMHVMSDHANEMSLSSNKKNGVIRSATPEDYINWMALARTQMLNFICRYCNETFVSRDNLALHMLTHAHLEETVSKNNIKRKLEVLETSSSSHQDVKLPRLSDLQNSPANYGVVTDTNGRRKPEMEYNLFCKECDIKFYALSEYEWHRERHRQGNLHSYDQPLCLTKSPDSNVSETVNEQGNKVTDTITRRRRNSFSFSNQTDKLQTSENLPKRPVSVGDCSTDTLKRFRNNHAEHSTKAIRKGTKVSVNSSVLDTINALSSSEQRIIYSVFGTDLGLSVDKEDESSRSDTCSPPVDLSSGKSKHVKENEHIRKDGLANGSLEVSASGLTKKNGGEESNKLVAGDSTHPMCKYCEILFFNKAIYYLHMGLHNVNNPWQCNVCGKVCTDAVDFAAHVIHM